MEFLQRFAVALPFTIAGAAGGWLAVNLLGDVLPASSMDMALIQLMALWLAVLLCGAAAGAAFASRIGAARLGRGRRWALGALAAALAVLAVAALAFLPALA
ncbi:MAG: hypothetical protein JWP20_558 [Roseomonas sp.]|jgi:hypothetical protein|nr:hypothetical protein [Roseomonas sp.]